MVASWSKSAFILLPPLQGGLSKNYLFDEKIIETQRLYLRTFTVDDAGLILTLNGDPAVTEYTGDGIVDLEQARPC